MRILFIVPYAPSLIRVRSYQLIAGLARRGHRLVVATVWSSIDDIESLAGLGHANVEVRAHYLPGWRKWWNCLRALPSGEPFQARYSWHPGLMREVLDVVRTSPVDIIHIEHLRGAAYGEVAMKACGGRTPVVWDSVDCISHLFRQAARQSRSLFGRIMTRLELPKTEAYEASLVRKFEHILVTSRCDKEALVELARADAAPGWTVPAVVCNGVELDNSWASDEVREPATLVMTGKMSYHANVTAAKYLVEDIMPKVWEQRPDVVVKLVGKDPPREVLLLANRRPNGGRGPAAGGVMVTGTVSDVRPFLKRATVAVAPVVYGAGVQNKVLEAMACGCAVVATPQAVLALDARPGRDLLVATGPDAFAGHVLNLLENPRLREDVGHAGRLYVESHHNWDTVAAALERVYCAAAGRALAEPVSA